MWEASVVAAIALAAAAFMLRFLIALLREGAPAVCYWVVTVRRNSEVDESYVDKNYHVPECSRSEWWTELLVENQDHAKEVRASSLISLDVRHVSARLGWRSIRKGVDVLRERRI
ncbi:MAG: hypothetical protein WAM78_00135 [Candidatus Sulfotelmatobacter sp.]